MFGGSRRGGGGEGCCRWRYEWRRNEGDASARKGGEGGVSVDGGSK